MRLDEANPLTGPLLPARLAENIERIEVLGQRLVRALAQRTPTSPQVEAPGPDLYASAMQAWFKLASEQPARIIGHQVRFWGDTLRHVAQAQHAFAKGFSAPPDDGPEDRRFANPLWRTNPFYSFVRRQYLINAEALRKAIADLEIEAAVDRRRIDWFTRQIIDMLSPTNFLATNPDALEKAIQTEGESLVKGLENLVADVEAGGGQLVVSLADRNAFRVGENIGTTPGDVVYRTPLFELIQYRPTTEQVHKVPLVMFPPWINKFYILDLKPENSLLRWLVGQGHTLFVVSWKNPDEHYADVGLEDYVAAYLEVIDKVLELTGEPRLNAIGYCIAGTTLAMTLSVMKQRGDDRVASASFFTALTDFSDQGEFTTFLQDDFVSGIEEEVARRGYLSAKLMQRTFSFLRANDLVWGPAIRSYMLGESPPAFDLLFWNGDGTNLPARMVTEYLRGLCQRNALATTGYPVLDVVAQLRDVTVPLCAIACEGDHIAPWKHSWTGIAQMESPERTFILSESGHIAGIINPPGKVKYGHYISDAGFGGTPDDWRKKAEHHQGSWWPRWGAWLAERAGDKVAARQPRDSLGAAPGSYVHETV
ncbi:PHA/PHB synthase family protein [Paracoccus endophyticus]|uniref:PHA/PHB synthase family protein n=1 Tax=Paracoccus endophyticus TaxID=2233774 RepID=UPI001F0BCA6C|nr:class I poly(R)-hydroxyalkanoic acid synthase [Paracoccus endophyticus]